MATLTITSISAERVPSGDSSSATDPYVRFILLDQDGYLPSACRTSALVDTTNPVWTDTLTIPVPAAFKFGSLRVCLWDADTASDDDAIGLATMKISASEVAEAKSIICKGLEQKGHGGYVLPPFKVFFTIKVEPDLNPLARCLKSCVACISSLNAQAKREEEAAAVLQSRAQEFMARKADAKEKDNAARVMQRKAANFLADKHAHEAAERKTDVHKKGVVSSLFQRAKTRPPREAEKDRPGRSRG